MRNQVVNHLQSAKPFDKQVEQSDHCQESPLQDQGWSGKQPVIEVVNRIIAERPEALAISQPYAHNVHATFGPDLRDEEARHKLHNPVTTHEWCWTLFKPGQVVYAKMHGTWSAYIVSGIMPPRALDGRYDVYVWFVRARGNTLVREFTKFSVEMWEGEVPITSLAVVPEEYWMDDLQGQDGKKPRMPLRQKLIEEGKLLWELLKEPTSKQYNGELVDEGIHIKDTQKGFVSGRVIRDSPGFGEYCPDIIFLRALEYHRGVLFLTTNRVQSFDAAFLSRIHVALHYKNLSNENRERIWAHSFENLCAIQTGRFMFLQRRETTSSIMRAFNC
ncbi:hypothetical protein MHUMG1_04167 [Metarhizium humberi]|uniref:DUF7025 domain-containing protein n=1 Tax=Metarhizium humberi TaxID=2596975 RepID=A0A9P8MBR7_9HYPO|nr:hypothetical protein MHUMG1_04167 [Metarhizium humberi]